MCKSWTFSGNPDSIREFEHMTAYAEKLFMEQKSLD